MWVLHYAAVDNQDSYASWDASWLSQGTHPDHLSLAAPSRLAGAVQNPASGGEYRDLGALHLQFPLSTPSSELNFRNQVLLCMIKSPDPIL